MNFRYLLETARFVRNQWLSQDKLIEIQNHKLRKLIDHAYYNVPYYRELFDSVELKPEDIKTARDLEQIPVTKKSQIQKLPLDKKIAKGTNIKKCIRAKTSGSTGRPLEIILSREDWMRNLSTWPRFLIGNGRKLTDKMLLILSPTSFSASRRKQWYEYLGLMRTEYISIWEDVNSQITAIRKIKPDVIGTYPSNLILLAKAIKREGMQDITPKILYSSAEVLTQEVRELCNSAFKVQMLDLYGSWETGPIAGECHKHKGYHVNIDSGVLEIVREGKPVQPGIQGEIVVTNLNFYTMPFIRYAMEDIGVFSKSLCPCGRSLPLLEKIEGRTDDFCILPSGKIISPRAFSSELRHIPRLSLFRVTQEEKDTFFVQIVEKETANPDNNIRINVEKTIRKIVGSDVSINVQIVDEIAKDPSGKLNPVISKVKLTFT